MLAVPEISVEHNRYRFAAFGIKAREKSVGKKEFGILLFKGEIFPRCDVIPSPYHGGTKHTLSSIICSSMLIICL